MTKRADIIWLEMVDSTNDEARRHISEIDNLSVVSAFSQSAGRGQRGNTWSAKAGENLTFSILAKHAGIRALDQFVISEITALSVVDLLAIHGINARIKWPNDIYFKDKKIAGILIKNEIKGIMLGISIIGIGLNINQTDFSDDIPNPISMKMITGKDYDLTATLSDICEEIKIQQTTFGKLCEDQNFQPSNFVFQTYTKHLYRYRQWALYEHNGGVKELMIIGFDKFGRLVLKEKNDREVVCDLKEISFKV